MEHVDFSVPFIVGLVVIYGIFLLFITIITKTPVAHEREPEPLRHKPQMSSFSGVTIALTKAFSLSKSRRRRELAGFVRESKEIERLLQRCQFYAEMKRTLKLGSQVQSLDEGEQRCHDEVRREFAILPQEVYQRVESLADCRIINLGNSWIKEMK